MSRLSTSLSWHQTGLEAAAAGPTLARPLPHPRIAARSPTAPGLWGLERDQAQRPWGCQSLNLNSVFPPEGLAPKARLNPTLNPPLFQEVCSDFSSLGSKEQLALAILSPLQVQGEDSGLRAWPTQVRILAQQP